MSLDNAGVERSSTSLDFCVLFGMSLLLEFTGAGNLLLAGLEKKDSNDCCF